jgi:predicted RNA polymerase sigma factor
MLLHESRRAARTSADGELILLADQDRDRWNRDQIAEGAALVERALTLRRLGPYTLQAAIAACHARARTAAGTDWARIVGLYGALAELAPSPIVELNRAVALAMHMGPAAGLAIVDGLRGEPALARYHLLPSVRGDLLMKLGRFDEARAELERAAALTQNARERALLLERAASCANRDS